MSKHPQLFHFDPAHEALARQLYQDACCGGEAVLKTAGSIRKALEDEATRRTFYRQAHLGFARAQESIIGKLVALEKQQEPTPKNPKFIEESLLVRKVADTIAWQLIGGQLYIARRLYAGQRPQKLSTSNYESVLAVAKGIMEPEFAKFALLSDTTTFIQMGDLAIMDTEREGLSFAEVKEGKRNHEYLEALSFLAKTRCPYYLQHFIGKEGPRGIEQITRIAKQAQKMGDVSDILNTGQGMDPHLNLQVHIPESPVDLAFYDDKLTEIIERSKEHDWAIEVIDDCLYVGAYRNKFTLMGALVFRSWFDGCAGRKDFPVINLMQCMESPLALPIFSRHLPEEQKFDLLFGRCKVCLGIDINKLMALAESRGIRARWSSRKEAAKLAGKMQVTKIDNRAVVFEREGSETMLSDGLLLRLIFHGTTPTSLVDIIERNFTDAPKG